jgi:hypothetical protein
MEAIMPNIKNKKLVVAKFRGEATTSRVPFQIIKKSSNMLTLPPKKSNKRLVATFSIAMGEKEIIFTLRGQMAKSLIALIKAGDKGCNALEVTCWALRFSGYIHFLRKDYGLEIITQREPHDGGWHARYFLLDEIEVVERSDDAKAR